MGPFAVEKLGAVRGGAPVSIVSRGANAYLSVFDSSFCSLKVLIYKLNNLEQPYRILKGTLLTLESKISNSDHMRFSYSGKLLAGSSYFTHFRYSGFVYNIEEDNFKRVIMERYYGKVSVGGGSSMFCLSQDETLMVLASSVTNNSKIKIFDISSIDRPLSIINMIPPGKLFETKSLCISPDNTMAAHHGHYMSTIMPVEKKRGIFLWKIGCDPASYSVEHIGTLNYESHNHDDYMVDMVFSPDSRQLLLGADKNSNDKMKLFDLGSRQLVFESAPLGTTTVSLLFTPSGKYLISGEKDGCVRVWSVEPASLNLYRTIEVTGEIFQICISPEERKLLVAHGDGKKMVAVSSVSLPAEILD